MRIKNNKICKISRTAAVFAMVGVMGLSGLTGCGGGKDPKSQKPATTQSQQLKPGKKADDSQKKAPDKMPGGKK